MKRLTFEGDFCDIAQCRALPCPCNFNCDQRKVWERLKEYEDTGLSPLGCAMAAEVEETLAGLNWSTARMREVLKADKAGRLVIMEDKGCD